MRSRRLTGTHILLILGLKAGLAHAEAQHVYFGDTHLHSSFSADAALMGNPSADPDTAYRYAKGLPVVHPNHRGRVQITTPLDFLAVSDHAEFLGIVPALFAGDPRVGQTPTTDTFLEAAQKGDLWTAFTILTQQGGLAELDPGMDSPEINRSTWQKITAAADAHYDPGNFTTLVAWEWSSMPTTDPAVQGPNLHRVVLLREGADTANQFLPFSSFQSQRPEDLWAWFEETSEATGATFLAIPHNSNIGLGRMFDEVDSDGEAIDARYARERMKWEPVAEVTQVKGDSETHPTLSPTDEFADYELFITAGSSNVKPGDFLRSTMRRGLEIESRVGVNPYQLGLIGASDSHTGLASVEEDNYHGKWGSQSTPERMLAGSGIQIGANMGAAGLAAVWANQNSREEIFDAFRRREVYATTGTRIRLRFFGGFDFAEADLRGDDFAQRGYTRGVPMGGQLDATSGKAPTFLVHALKDPAGANLDRIQIIKGWVDAAGESHEKVYDVALSDGRSTGSNGSAPAVGNTVDLTTGRYHNSIGAPQLGAAWTDPDFDPSQRSAFYYARVIEIPTPRHSLFDAIAVAQPHPENLPATVQERAYSSPIWLRR